MSTDFSHTVESIGPLHSIYVGSDPTGILSPEDRRRILDLCSEAFSSFTCIEARGYFRGRAEETLVIQVATSDFERLLALARDIAIAHDQLGIGLAGPEPGGSLVYRRIIPRRQHGMET
jgi:hypothetical protein